MILSIDLEDYYMVQALSEVVKRDRWDTYPSRVERNTHRLLDLIAHSGNGTPPTATFFCLGYVAERHPELIKTIHSQGHEIASHGYDHRPITELSPQAFREDIRKAKVILEDITGEPVLGYRAPSYSVTMQTLWALDILAEENFRYDSSIFPVHHDFYGIPNAPRTPFTVTHNGHNTFQFNPVNLNGHGDSKTTQPLEVKSLSSPPHNPGSAPRAADLLEFPITTLRIGGKNIPIAGGGYFRFFPVDFTLWAFRRTSAEGTPIIFYLHPWEIDSEQPRIHGLGAKSRFRHYLNLTRTEPRLKKLLKSFTFSSFRTFITQNHLSSN